MKDYRDAALVSVGLVGLSYLIGIILGVVTGVAFLELGAVALSYACFYLCIKQRRFQYVLGMMATTLFVIVFWQTGLVASAALNVWLTIQLIYGWFRWRRDEITRPVTNLSLRSLPLYALATVAMFFGGQVIVGALGGAMAGWDSLILMLSLLAQWLLDNKKIETWYVWTAVNLIQIPVYFATGLTLVAIQYCLFLGMNLKGWIDWRKSQKGSL